MEIQKQEAAKTAAERPLPPVPEIFVGQTEEMASSMKKTKQSNLVARWFAEKKAVRFSTADVFEVDHDGDKDELDDNDDDDDDDDVDDDEVEAESGESKRQDDDLSVYSPNYRSPRSVLLFIPLHCFK